MKTFEQVKEEMTARGLTEYFEALAPMARNAIRITLDVQDDQDLPIGISKFGGCPDLPAGMEWFRTSERDNPLSFIAQVNFAETAPFDLEHKLPTKGMLYFFYDSSIDGTPWEAGPGDNDGLKVVFYDGDLSLLSRREAPGEMDNYEIGYVYGAARMCFEAAMELPAPESDLHDHIEVSDQDNMHDQYWDCCLLDEEYLSNKLLGHADPVQYGMECELEYMSHNIDLRSPEAYEIGKARGLDKNAGRWNLLMQVDSYEEEIGMMWGDMGRLYLWITDEDLAARRFENTWLILQCG